MALPLAPIIAGAGAIASLFGKKKPAVSPYEQEQVRLMKQQQGITAQNQARGNQAYQRFTGLQGRSDTALNGLARTLQQDPYTDPYRAQELGKANAQVNDTFLRGRTNALADAARSGVSPDSSSVQGRLGYVDDQRAAAKSRNYLTLAQDTMANKGSRERELYALLSGASGNAGNEAQGYTNNAMSGYGNLSGQYGNLAQNDYARNAQYEAGQGQNVGNIAQILAMLLQGQGK